MASKSTSTMNTKTTVSNAEPTDAATGKPPEAAQLNEAATTFAAAPDPSIIARLANAFFTMPAAAVPGPGAALPSASVFMIEPAYAAIPGAPSIELPLRPNSNPGMPTALTPGMAAAKPLATIFVAEPLATEERSASSATTADTASISPAAAAAPAASRAFFGPPDFSAIQASLGEALSFVPRFDDPPPSSGMPATPGTHPGFLTRPLGYGDPYQSLPPAAASTPAQPAVTATPRDPLVEYLDLGALPSQHRPDIAPAQVSGVRAFDAHVFRRDFPILDQYVNGRRLIWLDNGATTQKPEAVIERLVRFYKFENSNIHRAAHALASRSTDAYEAAREKVRRFINAPNVRDILFVRGATEGINLIAQAWGRRNISKDDEIVVTHLEHHSNIVPWQQLAVEKDAKLRVAPVDDSGEILLDEYEKLINPRTRIVAITHVSNALGTVTPVQDMAAIARRHGAKVLVDGAQSVSHMPIDVQMLDADFFIFSGHKMFAPTGIGVVFGKAGELEAMPPWQGGGNMIADVTFERTTFQGAPERFEAGTGSIADAVGLGAAIDYLNTIGMANIATYEHELIAYTVRGLSTVPGLKVIGSPRVRAGVVSFVLEGHKTEEIGKALDREGIAVRAGHHCAQPILRRFGVEATVWPSLALYNTTEDIDALVEALLRMQGVRGPAL